MATHRRRVKAFRARWPDLHSDVPTEPALNHAVTSAMAAGLSISPDELVMSAIVVDVTLTTTSSPTAPTVAARKTKIHRGSR